MNWCACKSCNTVFIFTYHSFIVTVSLTQKAILAILFTSLLALGTAAVITNNRTNQALEDFREEQEDFFERRIFSDGSRPSPQQRVLRQLIEGSEKQYEAITSDFQRRTWQGIAISSLFAIGAATIIGVYFSRRMTHPLHTLQKHTQELKAQRYGQPIAVESRDEIGDLAQTFEELRQHLQQLDELRKNVISDLAHEIMTPIQSSLGTIEGIEEGIYQPQDKLGEVKASLNRIQMMVDDLRQFSHARSGNRDLKQEMINILEFYQQYLIAFHTQAEEKGLAFEIMISKELSVVGDKRALDHILSNLLKNAITFTQKGGKIQLVAQKTEEGIAIRVKDTGVGIKMQDQAYVFERFFRTDESRAQDTGGTGLGLSIAKEYADRLGWRLEVESELGVGSEFCLMT